MGVKTLKTEAELAKQKMESEIAKNKKNKTPEWRERKKVLKAREAELKRLYKDLKKEQ